MNTNEDKAKAIEGALAVDEVRVEHVVAALDQMQVTMDALRRILSGVDANLVLVRQIIHDEKHPVGAACNP